MAKDKPLSEADLKAIHAKEFDKPVVEDKERDKKVAKQLRDLKPDKADKAHKDSKNKQGEKD